MKRILFISVFLACITSLFAKEVSVETAKTVAKNIYYERISQLKPVIYEGISVKEVLRIEENTQTLIYIVNLNNGFVLLSADDLAAPVIGYSFDKSFNLDKINPGLELFLTRYKEQINMAIAGKSTDSEIADEWAYYMDKDFALNEIKHIKTVDNFMLTEWGQDSPYNGQCPENANGKAIVGCVALSMAQAMKYYDYPETGQGSHSYSHSGWGYNENYGTLSANFGSTTYKWANMPLKAHLDNDDLGTMLYHCGVAVDMSYSATGSGSQTAYVEDALRDYFRYATDVDYKSKDNDWYDSNTYTDSEWKDMLKSNLNAGYPLVYSGHDPDGGGHAWNVAGYQNDEFFMNWGWDGFNNAFYSLDNLIAGGYSFTSGHAAVSNIYPLQNYPEYCTGTKTIDGVEGSFNDGSGMINDYQNNQSCSYLIQPDCAITISLNFDELELGTGDNLYIYDGSSDSDPLLKTYTSASTLSSLNSTDGSLFLKFVTDGSSTGSGWTATYRKGGKYCSGTSTISQASGTLEDGSGDNCNYNNSTNCYWRIQPPNATAITLNFVSFDLSDSDKLMIYDEVTSNILKTYSAGDNPSTYTANTSKIRIRFIANGEGNAGGWKFNYNAVTGIDENPYITKPQIYPNPTQNELNVKFTLLKPQQLTAKIINTLGEVVYQEQLDLNVGEIEHTFNLKNTANGMYLLQIVNENGQIIKQIIKE